MMESVADEVLWLTTAMKPSIQTSLGSSVLAVGSSLSVLCLRGFIDSFSVGFNYTDSYGELRCTDPGIIDTTPSAASHRNSLIGSIVGGVLGSFVIFLAATLGWKRIRRARTISTTTSSLSLLNLDAETHSLQMTQPMSLQPPGNNSSSPPIVTQPAPLTTPPHQTSRKVSI